MLYKRYSGTSSDTYVAAILKFKMVAEPEMEKNDIDGFLEQDSINFQKKKSQIQILLQLAIIYTT